MIQRYFNPSTFNIIKKDFLFLSTMLEKYYGEIEFSIRDNYFNLYYKGNSLSRVKYNVKGYYDVSINKKFFDLSKAQADKRFTFIPKGDSFIGKLDADLLHPFFQKTYIDDLCARIRKVNNGEEIEFEQSIITDNIDNPEFFIIDRQVSDTELKLKRIDLLALKQIKDQCYRFVVLEVKLGKNAELQSAVVGQLNHYMNHIKTNLNDYADCYEKNYEQRKEMGFISIPYKSIIIDRKDIEGIVVVGGYSKIADKYISSLKSNHVIDVKQFKFKLP